MNKDFQKSFYKIVGDRIGHIMQRRNITKSQLARKADVQYNTIDCLLMGRPFSFHQCIWIMDYLHIDINELIKTTTEQMFKEKINGKEKEESESFI